MNPSQVLGLALFLSFIIKRTEMERLQVTIEEEEEIEKQIEEEQNEASEREARWRRLQFAKRVAPLYQPPPKVSRLSLMFMFMRIRLKMKKKDWEVEEKEASEREARWRWLQFAKRVAPRIERVMMQLEFRC